MKKSIIVLAALFFGCTTAQKTVQSKQTFSFDYTPKQTVQAGSVNMLLGLVHPYYVSTFQVSSSELFRQFRTAIGNDIEELIVAKGFNLKGPYESYDDMVFDDKKSTDVVIQIEMDPQFTAAEGTWKNVFTMNGWMVTYSGKVSLIGKINLSGVEPLTNQKIWSKSVSIPPIENIIIETSQKYDHVLSGWELYQDPGVYNAVGQALSLQYKSIMEKIAAQINAEEFISMQQELTELKAKKGY